MFSIQQDLDSPAYNEDKIKHWPVYGKQKVLYYNVKKNTKKLTIALLIHDVPTAYVSIKANNIKSHVICYAGLFNWNFPLCSIKNISRFLIHCFNAAYIKLRVHIRYHYFNPYWIHFVQMTKNPEILTSQYIIAMLLN